MNDNGYVLLGHKGQRSQPNYEIIYSNYIPICEVLTAEEQERRRKAEVAGKRYAKVSIKHPDCRTRCKRGQIVDEKVENGIKKVCIRIEKRNICSENGHMTWMGPGKMDWANEWVEESLLSQIWKYDKDGNEVDMNDKPIVSDGCKSEISEAKTSYGKDKQKQ